MTYTDSFVILERLISCGDPETILKCSTPHGARTMAKAICAADPEAERDFGEGGLAHYLRATARPQERAARRALAEAERIEAAKEPLTLELLDHCLRHPDVPVPELRATQAELRRKAFAFIDTPEKLAATAEFLFANDPDARSRFRDVNELAAFLRTDQRRKPESAPVAAAAIAVVAAAAPAPVAAAERDLTDAEIALAAWRADLANQLWLQERLGL